MAALLDVLRAAGEPTRLRLIALLARGELTVSELTQILGQSQPRVSRHLKVLVDAGLLDRKPEGSWAFYRLAQEGGGARLAAQLAGEIPQEDPALASDLERLEIVKAARAAAAEAYFRINAKRWNDLRSLHVAEAEVEQAILDLLGTGRYRHFVDLGTGTGRMLELVAPFAERASGIDTSHEMLTLARTRIDKPQLAHCQVQRGDIFALPFAGGEIDLILIHQVLHYLADPQAAIAEAARVLAPGGRLLIVDFAPHGIEDLRLYHAHRRLGFSAEEIAGHLRAAGLEVDAVTSLAPAPGGDGKERLTVTLWRAHAQRA